MQSTGDQNSHMVYKMSEKLKREAHFKKFNLTMHVMPTKTLNTTVIVPKPWVIRHIDA